MGEGCGGRKVVAVEEEMCGRTGMFNIPVLSFNGWLMSEQDN